MKLLDAFYGGVDGIFIKVIAKLEIEGRIIKGALYFENDGKDIDTDEPLRGYHHYIISNIDDIYNDPIAMDKLNDAFEKGAKELKT